MRVIWAEGGHLKSGLLVECLGVSDTALIKTLDRGDSGRTQRVWISYEVVKPDYEVVRIHSPFARVGAVELAPVVRQVGQLLVGALGYLAAVDEAGDPDNGILTVGTTVPLDLLGPGQVADMFMHVPLIAGAADRLEEQFGLAGDLY